MAAGTLARIAELETELAGLRRDAADEARAALPESFGVLVVQAAAARVALPLAEVHEVLPRVMLFRLPSAPAWHAGSLAWRGAHVPVVDLAARWAGGSLPVALEDRIVLVQCAEGLRGVLVAEVLGVETLTRAELTAAPHGAAVGLATRGGDTIALVAPARLFERD